MLALGVQLPSSKPWLREYLNHPAPASPFRYVKPTLVVPSNVSACVDISVAGSAWERASDFVDTCNSADGPQRSL